MIARLRRLVDERFREHRRRSTAVAGLAGAAVAGGLFLHRLLTTGVVDRALAAVLATIALVKLALMAWHLARD